jgi:hypothetical protein
MVARGLIAGPRCCTELIQGIKTAHPDRVLMCEHWDDRTNAYNPWMIDYIGFDAGWLNFRQELQKVLTP